MEELPTLYIAGAAGIFQDTILEFEQLNCYVCTDNTTKLY